jgi:aquaporin Z
MPSIRALAYRITALHSSASFVEAIKTHWREYLMEAAELAVLMFCICLTGALLYGVESPLRNLPLSLPAKAAVMGVIVATTTFLLIRSSFGRRTGAHLNPALTLAYVWLGRIHRWDAVNYVVAQFLGGLAGVFIASQVIGRCLSADPVDYVVTLPGRHGNAIAFLAEFFLAAIFMGVVLFATNHRQWTRFSPLLVALITVLYYVLGPTISGFSVNPARSFSSAFFAQIWHGIWIYFAGPSLGMLIAAALYVRSMGANRVYCAKIFHDLRSPCPFPCRFEQLFRQPESNTPHELSS